VIVADGSVHQQRERSNAGQLALPQFFASGDGRAYYLAPSPSELNELPGPE
jgi:hypothetical protein